MRSLPARCIFTGTVTAVAVGLVTALAGITGPALAQASISTAAGNASAGPSAIPVPQHPEPPGVPVVSHPLFVSIRGRGPDGRPAFAGGAPGGYTATELRAFLQLHGTGAGQTVAIVDAFDDPYASLDVASYSRQFGLPLPCSKTVTTDCFSFQVLHPFGIGGLDTGWALEESLDVQMVHALAPRASIELVEAHDSTTKAVFKALGYAAGLHAEVISNSWGAGESTAENSYDHYCQLTAAVCTFSSGDSGHPGLYPAYNPAVIAVGGTTLSLTAAGVVTSETAWSVGLSGAGGSSGGGISRYEPRPTYQDGDNPYAGRGIPDVSFDANPNTGVAVYSSAWGGWVEVGGTSVGAPAWAAILAAADQLRSASGKPPLTAAHFEAQKALYHLTRGLFDVTSGSNGSCGAVCTAGPGYDFVTGLGAPRPGIDTALAAAP